MKELEKYIRTNYPIQTWMNNDILRKRSKEVEEITDDIKEFADILHAGMELYDGIWLAAPQIGVNIRMIAVCKLNNKWNKVISSWVFINPEIIEKSKQCFVEKEWCLSLPWLEWKVKRHMNIRVKYLDINWKEHQKNFKWINASIRQHEIDHLDGVLFWDKTIWENKSIDVKKLIKFNA